MQTDIERYFDACVRSIAEIVKIDSSQCPALPGKPFGEGAARALHYFLRLAESFGFETHNYDNYIGEVVFGSGEPFAILCHLDVVPAGSGWTHDPFGGEIADGKIYGRGTTDDKGPAVICLYCLKALKDAGFAPKRTIKLIVGCNEESGWACIEHYNACAEMPKEGFSPDADFPVIYAEKGILHVRFDYPLRDAPFAALEGGERENMVCDYARADGAALDAARAARYGVSAEGASLVAHGRSAHASTPDAGENALEKLLPANSKILAFYRRFEIRKWDEDTDGYKQWVFKDKTLAPECFPENTTLQRNMKKYVLSGGKVGEAWGILKS